MQISKYNVSFTEILDTTPVKLTKTGNIFEVMAYLHKSKGSDVRKLSNDTYYQLRDKIVPKKISDFSDYGFEISDNGEILNVRNEYILKSEEKRNYFYPVKYYKKTTNRFQTPNELRRTFKKIRNIINCNVSESERCKFCTITYAENMTDTKRLCDDFRKFNQRFKRYVKKEFDMKYEYIAIAEPQGRGAWHMHILYIFDDVAPYIHYNDYAEIWGLGTVDLEALKDIDNLGAYFSAYLSDIAVTDETELNFNLSDKKICQKENKKVIKGGRLTMYPTKFNILRTSRGIKRPVIEEMFYKDAKEEISSHISDDFNKSLEECCTFRNCVEVHIKDGKEFHNKIWYEYYNVVRKYKNKPFKTYPEENSDDFEYIYEYDKKKSAFIPHKKKKSDKLLKLQHYNDFQSVFSEAWKEVKKCADMGYFIDVDEMYKNKNFNPENVNILCSKMLNDDIKSGKIIFL